MNNQSQQQLIFDLSARPALSREDFLVSKANEEAVAWMDAWPQWSQYGLVLLGESGCGKTHLATVWQARSQACYVRAPDISSLFVPDLLAQAPALIVDDMHKPFSEEGLLHLCKEAKDRGQSVLFVGRQVPTEQGIRLPDLSSRLKALPYVWIKPPDDDLLAAVIVKLFFDRQITVGDEVIRYFLTYHERTFAAIQASVAALDRAALSHKRPITLPFIRHVFGHDTDY